MCSYTRLTMATARSDRVPAPTGLGASLRLPTVMFGQPAVIVADQAREEIRIEVHGDLVLRGHLPAHLAVRMRDTAIDCLRALGETNALLAMRAFVQSEALIQSHVLGQRPEPVRDSPMTGELREPARDGQRRDPLHPAARGLGGRPDLFGDMGRRA